MRIFLFILAHFVLSEAFEWKTLDDALIEAKKNESLVMFYMSKSNCKPCNKLNEQLESSKEFEELSKSLVLAQAVDDLPTSDDFKLDGKYVPKIIFLNSNKVILKDVVNTDAKSDKAKYFYNKLEHVLKSMQKALSILNLDHGFGKDYLWYDWETGLQAAAEQNKPILVVFHQDWCGACQRLKPKFAESAEIKKYAQEFIMVNTDKEEVVKSDKYKADGEYYPKILFLDSDGEHYSKEWNHGTKHTHVLHYYGDGEEISKSMERVIENRTLILANDNGFGKHIKWVKYQQGLKIAKEQNKPILLIIHKSYCGACKALKPKVRNDPEIAEMSKKFVMINCEDDEEPDEDQYDQDGAYIPRIFFLDNNGKVEASIYNPDGDYSKSRYAYGSAQSILQAMKIALGMNLGQREAITTEETITTSTPTATAKSDASSLSDGFGTSIKWYPYEEGLREAKKSHKAVMIIFYNDWCLFSSYMKEHFRESSQIIERSQNFVMINVDEEKAKELGDKFNIDGTYTPRIFFMDPDQNIHLDVNNTETLYKSTMYYYGTPEEIVKAMDLAVQNINLTLGRGFGEYIKWVKYEKALELAKEQNRPMMLIIHKTWCGACAALKPIIANSRPIWELTKYFIMANVEDEEEPLDNQYFIDGGYYPRIYFLDSNGTVHHDLHNRDPTFLKYKFSYQSEDQIVHTMKFAVYKFFTSKQEQQEEKQKLTTQTQETSTETTSNSSTDSKKLSPGKKLLAESGLKWNTIDDALAESKTTGKPILFLIHRTTCPACKAVLRLISRSEEFKGKSSLFVLADIEDDVDDEKADTYDVDGGYVPRIYFLDTEGKIMKDIWNKGTNYLENKYYYYEMNSLIRSMEVVSESVNNKTNEEQEKKKDEL